MPVLDHCDMEERPGSSRKGSNYGIKQLVTVASQDPSIDLPGPDFLDTHHQVAKILEVSGIGDKIDNIPYESELDA